MLIQARQARTANAFAPRQEKKSIASGRIRWHYGPQVRFWFNGVADSSSPGSTCTTANDWSGLGVSILQTSSSLRPIKSVVNNVVGWSFDGVDDSLTTGNINLAGGNKMSIFSVARQAVATSGILIEIGGGASINGGFQYYRDNVNKLHCNSYSGLSYNEKTIDTTLLTWNLHAYSVDRSKVAASEIVIYSGTTKPTTATVVANDLSANFENRAASIGNWNASSLPFNGQISQILMMNICVTDAEQAEIATWLQQITGLL